MMRAIDNLPHELLLGRQTENGVTVISIDVQSWLGQWPGMETVIMATRPGENAAYPAATRMDGSCIVWTVNGADTAIAGRGTAEILGLVDGVRKLSQIVRTRIKASTVAATTEPPESAQPWVDTVINAADEIKNMTATAETLQPGEEATASYADGKLTLGIPRGVPGEPGAKGDKGDPGPQGDKGEPGSDAEVTAENIQSALGYAPVKDVQVAGNSVLVDGVANVPMASETKDGVIKAPYANGAFGIQINSDNRPYVSAATEADITARQTFYRPIVPPRIDYAVKAAMCDGKGAAWTSTEQKAARERMGADGNYVLIEETVLTEETSQFERAQEPDGTPYNFTAIRVVVKFVPGQTNGAFFCFGENNGIRIVGGASQTLVMPSLSGAASWRSVAVFNARPGYGGFYDCDVAVGGQGGAMAITRAANGAYTMTETSKKIQKVAFYLYSSAGLPMITGTEISIYGVRA